MVLKTAGAVLFAGLVGATAAMAQYEPPPPLLTTAPCVPTKKLPCITSQPAPAPAVATPDASKDFPFPGDDTKSAEKKPADAKPANEEFPFPGDTPAAPSNAPAAAKPVSPADASKEFPLPSDAGVPSSSAAPGESSSSSSSSSSANNNASSDPNAPNPDADDNDPRLKDLGSEGSTKAQRRKLPKVESVSDREAEDLTVSKYYYTTGNFKGAYMRAQDAVKSVPDDSEAHYALAQAARKMDKKDEAVAEYNAYLKLDPDGPHAKFVHDTLEDWK